MDVFVIIGGWRRQRRRLLFISNDDEADRRKQTVFVLHFTFRDALWSMAHTRTSLTPLYSIRVGSNLHYIYHQMPLLLSTHMCYTRRYDSLSLWANTGRERTCLCVCNRCASMSPTNEKIKQRKQKFNLLSPYAVSFASLLNSILSWSHLLLQFRSPSNVRLVQLRITIFRVFAVLCCAVSVWFQFQIIFIFFGLFAGVPSAHSTVHPDQSNCQPWKRRRVEID